MKLLEASDEDFEEEDTRPRRRSSSRIRHTSRIAKRTAVIQSSSDSDGETSERGRQTRRYFILLFLLFLLSHNVFLLCFLGSQNTKDSDGESKAEDEGNDSDISSSSQIKQNGDAKSTKQKTVKPTVKTKGNGKKFPHIFYFSVLTLLGKQFRLLLSEFNFFFFADALSHVNGHSGKHDKSESNSEQEATPEDSSAEEEKQKVSRSASANSGRKTRIVSEEDDDTEAQPARRKPPVSSDEDKGDSSQNHLRQNGQNVKESFPRDSKRKSKVLPSKSQDKQESASTDKGAESEELSSSQKKSSPHKKGVKNDFEIKRTRNKSKRPRCNMSASESSEQEYAPRRKSRRKRSTGSSEEESDQSDDPSNRRLNLRALPKKKYIVDNSLSEDDSAPVNQHTQRNGKKRETESSEDRYKTQLSNRTSPSEARNQLSKRKRTCTSESEEEEDGERKPVNSRNNGSRSLKHSKREPKQESDSSSHSDSSQEERVACLRNNARQSKPRRKKSCSSKNSSDSESEQSSSASENSFASSGSHSSPKRRSRARTRISERPASRQLRQRRRQVASEEEDSDEPYSKPQRKTRVNTRNRGKRTVNYQDSE